MMPVCCVEWNNFVLRFLKTNLCAVKENEDSWEVLTEEQGLYFYCKIAKQSNEEDIMFVQRYFTENTNVVKVEEFKNLFPSEVEVEDYDQTLELEENGGLDEVEDSEVESDGLLE